MNTWTTKTGKTILISEMKTSHIRNSIKMMELNGFCSKKQLNTYLRCNYNSMGDVAQMAFDRELDNISCKIPSDLIDSLQEELDKRNEICIK